MWHKSHHSWFGNNGNKRVLRCTKQKPHQMVEFSAITRTLLLCVCVCVCECEGLLRFLVQRKFVKSEKRRTLVGVPQNEYGLFTTIRDMCLITRNRTVLTLWSPVKCPATMCHGRPRLSLSLFVSYVFVVLVTTNSAMHLPRDPTPFLSLQENTFDIFR